MKIEKMSDTQVRVILNKSDLLEREIKISELAYGSDKAQKLFKDMMKKAFDEFGFEANNVPLMIEAVPMSTESIMIIVTKVDDPDEIDDKLANLTPNKNIRKFKKKSEIEEDFGEVIDLSERKNLNVKQTFIYTFNKLDHIIDASYNIEPEHIESTLYKNENTKKLFLVLHCSNKISSETEKVLLEYGNKVDSSDIAEGYLKEHTTTIIDQKAISKLKLI
ncbi:adaptor protein MecA [Vallitalea okinawensis]|uniref:adaptor protein MecA n=1 Tax=Vallitalea okinawensis TaxID=2078660 RepID=UPI0013002168|nr:adaptor protein MecA [Vallitalea okinawensis]